VQEQALGRVWVRVWVRVRVREEVELREERVPVRVPVPVPVREEQQAVRPPAPTRDGHRPP
jgi:hypothetical protein